MFKWGGQDLADSFIHFDVVDIDDLTVDLPDLVLHYHIVA